MCSAVGWQVSGSDHHPRSDPAYRVLPDDSIRQSIRRSTSWYIARPCRRNIRAARARQLGIPALSYPQMLGRLMAARTGVAVAGTHGKSTTTAMAGEMLAAAGFDPTRDRSALRPSIGIPAADWAAAAGAGRGLRVPREFSAPRPGWP